MESKRPKGYCSVQGKKPSRMGMMVGMVITATYVVPIGGQSPRTHQAEKAAGKLHRAHAVAVMVQPGREDGDPHDIGHDDVH
jgi:hypothetical protein